MPHDLRKIRKMRGSRTHGYGRVGQHRKSGSRGERKVGRHKAGWSWVLRYNPNYFGKTGFRSPRARKETKVLNLKELGEIATSLSSKKVPTETKIPIDLTEMGFDKLLGEGKIGLAVSVKVSSCSKTALQRIEEAGGEVLTDKAKNA